MSKTLSSYKCR